MSINKEDIQKDILLYAKYLKEDFMTPDHIIKTARILNEFVFGDLNRLIITMPPRHGKSFLCSEILPTFLLGNFPNCKIITASYASGLSNNFSREVIKILRSPKYHKLFPETRMTNNVDCGTVFLNETGHYLPSSRGGTITGLGGNYIILDDMLKNSAEASSPAILRTLRDWYDTTLYSRLLPKGKIIFLQTRWCADDLAGYILDNDSLGEWKLVNFPALNENDEALWEECFSREYLMDIRERNGRQFECLYQGNPSREGKIQSFNLDDYDIIPLQKAEKRNYIYKFSSWDTASKLDPHHCYTSGTLWGVTYDKKIVMLDHVKFKKIIPQTKKAILKKHEEWGCRYTLIEDANSGTGFIQEFKTNPMIKCKSIPADVKSKLTIVIAALEDSDVTLSNIGEVLQELEDYPEGEFSDSVASVVNAIWWWVTSGNKKSLGSDKPFSKGVRSTNLRKRRPKFGG